MRTLLLAVVMLAIPPALFAQTGAPFPHARHAKLFPLCSGCHAGITTNDAAHMFPAVTQCAACHDGTIQARVQWTPSVRGALGLLVFSHATHGANAKGVDCTSCHAVADSTQWMNVARATPERCMSCHTHAATTHMADDRSCTTCHRPLTAATGLSDARVAAIPKPPSHTRADFVSAHGPLALAANANCATCHARETCVRCHVNGTRVPPIRALASDARVARLVAHKAPVYPEPADHRADNFALVHGGAARKNIARCATCHARASCETCHTGDGAREVLRGLPDAREATAPGVQLRHADALDPKATLLSSIAPPGVTWRPHEGDTTARKVSVHPAAFTRAHARVAAAGELNCTNCHAQRFCTDCHGGTRVTHVYHPANFVSIHAPQAYGREVDCATCHSREAFCRDCHRQTGIAAKANVRSTVFHNAQPLWLLQHGRAARQDLPSCTTCHQQTYCMQCHSDLGARISPHGPGFNAAQMSRANPRLCLTCHLRNPLGG